VVSKDFLNDEGQKLLGNVWVEFTDRSETPQTTDLLRFSAGIARGQSVSGLQFTDCLGTPEPLRQEVDDRGIDIIDAIPQSRSLEPGSAVSAIIPSPFSFCRGV